MKKVKVCPELQKRLKCRFASIIFERDFDDLAGLSISQLYALSKFKQHEMISAIIKSELQQGYKVSAIIRKWKLKKSFVYRQKQLNTPA